MTENRGQAGEVNPCRETRKLGTGNLILVWDVVSSDLPVLKVEVTRLLAELDPPSN
jgi:hypothetical protein